MHRRNILTAAFAATGALVAAAKAAHANPVTPDKSKVALVKTATFRSAFRTMLLDQPPVELTEHSRTEAAEPLVSGSLGSSFRPE